ncbi:MAG: DUF1043 family protein [Gammaproteobacteria bacterium]|jgi:uncharacterized membrane-anchored protein YhcB (DUF1043 family)
MIALEETSSMWIVGILGLLLGITLGSVAAYLVFSRNSKTRHLQSELNELKERFTDYRDQVTRHFMQTSSLVQEMTDRYRAVYEHLASGAQHLCNVDTGTDHLEQHHKNDKIDAAQAAGIMSAEAGFDYDDLAELSSIRKDIDQLMGVSTPVPEQDSKAEKEKAAPLQH